jgi:hypothetical protein
MGSFLTRMRIFRPLFILLIATSGLVAQTPKPELISPQVKAAVEKAVGWLIRSRSPPATLWMKNPIRSRSAATCPPTARR